MFLLELREFFVLLADDGVEGGDSFAGLKLKHREILFLLLER